MSTFQKDFCAHLDAMLAYALQALPTSDADATEAHIAACSNR